LGYFGFGLVRTPNMTNLSNDKSEQLLGENSGKPQSLTLNVAG
jgi:hypothetical protein